MDKKQDDNGKDDGDGDDGIEIAVVDEEGEDESEATTTASEVVVDEQSGGETKPPAKLPAWGTRQPTIRIRSQSVKEIIDEKQLLTLSWNSLTVHVGDATNKSNSSQSTSSGGGDHQDNYCCCCVKMCCCCNCGPFKQFAFEYLGTTKQNEDPFYAIDTVSGLIKTGEMCLVLSPNHRNASILLRSLSGRLHDAETAGTIALNGYPLTQNHHGQSWRRLIPYVAASDTTHAAVLTVRETLTFAAQCCCSSSSTGNNNNSNIDQRVDAVLEALDLTNVADTVVGDENLRGISGGQKRRVTVGEMLFSNEDSGFLALEHITDGLSSQDSFNLIRRMKNICTTFKMGAIISLLQPSDDIVNSKYFDKLMVLSENGQLNYFGTVDRTILQPLFEGGGGDNNNNSGGSICDLVLRSHDKSTDQIQSDYQQSAEYANLFKSLGSIRSKQQQQDGTTTSGIDSLLAPTKYASSYKYQFQIIASRRMKLIARNAVTYTRIVIAIVFGVIVGSLFGELNQDIPGSMARTGYMFLNCFLVLMLSAAITIPQTFRERITLFKHREAEFYSGRVAYIAQLLLDIPLSMLEAILLAVVSYFWVDMNPNAKNFFYFMAILIGLEFVGQSLGRFLCAISRKQILANMLSSAAILVFGTCAGFMPNYQSIPTIFWWLSWVTPASYAFEGLMMNEFVGRDLNGSVVTTEQGTTEILSFSGEQWLQVYNLPRQQWATDAGIKVFDFVMLFVLSLCLDLLGCYFMEHTREWYFNKSRRPQRTTVSTNFLRGVRGGGHGNEGVVKEEEPEDTEAAKSHWPNSLSVQNICYYVPFKSKRAPLRCTWRSLVNPLLVSCFGKKKGEGGGDDGNDGEEPVKKVDSNSKRNELQLLNNINARFSRGRMTALMGTSGAGKTTLLDVIAGYKTGGRITGDILIDGYEKQPDVWKNISAYAEQMDILNPYLSTLETLRFTAACRLSGDDVNREDVINDVVRLMELEDYTDMVVGHEKDGEGLPKHARKRLTIATQLVTLPKILFCDEPTTGLGTSSANVVMQALRRCTNELNLITVVTIHQPSKLIWDAFDDLLLLVKGGNIAYMGPMGDHSETVIGYFQKLSGSGGTQSQQATNPADYVLSCVSKLDVSNVIETYQKSDICKEAIDNIESDIATELSTSASATAVKDARKQARAGKSFCKELLLLTKRHFMTQWRNPTYSMMRLLASFAVSLYMAILFVGDKSTIEGAIFSIGAIFFLIFVLVIPAQATVVHLIEDRAVLYREVTSGLYTKLAYGLGQLISDIPFHILNALVMFIMFYFIVGFQVQGDLIGYFILMTFAANWVMMSLGQFFALSMPNEESATGLAGLSIILSVILMGFLITVNAMPSGWTWAYWANLIHYIVQGFTTNELVGRNYTVILPMPENATNALFFPTGTDLSGDSVANAASNFLSMAVAAGPGSNADWNNSGIVSVGSLVDCMVANDCLVEPLATNFISCCVFDLFNEPPCKDELDKALENVNISGVVDCVQPYIVDSAVEGITSGLTSGLNLTLPNPLDGLTEESVEDMSSDSEMDMVLCLLRVLMPPGTFDSLVQSVTDVLGIALEVVPIVIDVVENGLSIPGELILWIFSWAEWQPEVGLVAPYKWWYCMFAVAMFLVGMEILKLLALQFVVWTKR